MPTLWEIVKSNPGYHDWYQGELNTSHLVKQVVADWIDNHGLDELSGLKMWNLFRLCWWTKADDHWKRIKIPALENLYGKPIGVKSDLRQTLSSATHLARHLAQIASEETGFVNFRPVWRQSSKAWCIRNAGPLRNLLQRVITLTPNDDEERIRIAKSVAALPKIPSPSGARECRPELLLTPFIMCLDPQCRFPVLNGREAVTALLASMELKDSPLEKQVEGMLLLIGRYTIRDAMMIDALAGSDELRRLARQLASPENQVEQPKGAVSKTTLRYHDDAEREAIRKAASIVFHHLHNTMTRVLGQKFGQLSISQGASENCRFDALIEDYDGNGRNLLIEAKPDPDRGSIRIAIGQLFDYRRFLAKPNSVDLAVLTIGSPTADYLDLLRSLRISALWFTEDTCKNLAGEGTAWTSLRKHLPDRQPAVASPTISIQP
jgi:hypothetical protein